MIMDQSCIGDLYQKNDREIKRKRKIQYRKSKGRLTVQTSGILNKSICKKSFSRSLNESRSNNQGHLVSVQNVNAFLSKNRELAKALEECRQQTKNLENQKFTYQLECIEMREKLSIYQNAILKCKCCQDLYKTQIKMQPSIIDKPNVKLIFRLLFIATWLSKILLWLINKKGKGFH